MTNEEKAYEISQSSLIEDGIWHYATAEIAAIIMAEWKDQQFKEQKAIDEKEYTEEMHRLNEEWKANLVIQREMLINKGVAWVDHNVGTLTAIALRKAMEEE